MNLKNKLEYFYQAFNQPSVSIDPIECVQKFKYEKDIEAVAFISSILSFGNVPQIKKSINFLISVMGSNPYNFLTHLDFKKNLSFLKDFKHRFLGFEEITLLFKILNHVYLKHISLKEFFLLNYNPYDRNLKQAISKFSIELIKIAKGFNYHQTTSNKLAFMFPDPFKGSACKRMNLFLRWMVRKDNNDFGIWDEIPKSKLVIPVDVHISRICQKLKLTRQKSISWKMAEEITENLKMFDPDDPVKYDYALCHIGISKLII